MFFIWMFVYFVYICCMENLKEKTLIQILDDAGVKILRNNPKSRALSHLEYNGKIIIAPRVDRCYEVVKEKFGIDLTKFNN